MLKKMKKTRRNRRQVTTSQVTSMMKKPSKRLTNLVPLRLQRRTKLVRKYLKLPLRRPKEPRAKRLPRKRSR